MVKLTLIYKVLRYALLPGWVVTSHFSTGTMLHNILSRDNLSASSIFPGSAVVDSVQLLSVVSYTLCVEIHLVVGKSFNYWRSFVYPCFHP